MDTRTNTIFGLLAVCIVALIGFIAYQNQSAPLPVPTPQEQQAPVQPSIPTPTPAPAPAPTPVPTSTQNPLIQVTGPTANALVTSPLNITGRARGNWYFEASFPIRIEDANGVVLGRTTGQAIGNWMTTNFVPFTATLTFTTPTTTTGWLFLEKDNPSGLPANDAFIQIPVTF